MALGYEGYVSFTHSGNTFTVLSTGANVTSNDRYLKSNSGFYGDLSLDSQFQAMDLPLDLDYQEVGGSVSFEANNQVVGFIKELIKKRSDSFGTKMVTRKNASQVFSECYWTDISLSASEGGMVSGSINVSAVKMDSYNYGVDRDQDGSGIFCDLTGESQAPIPFWKSTILVNGSSVGDHITEWSLSLQQPVNKFFGCNALGFDETEPSPPRFFAVGPATGSFTASLILHEPFEREIDNLTIGVGGVDFDLKLIRDNQEEPVVTGSNLSVIPMKYFIRKISFS